MIILSAQRVLSKNKSGINCSLYRHAPDPPRKPDGDIDEAAAFAERGELIAYQHDLRPGGNRISSYVDIVLLSAQRDAVDRIVAAALHRLKTDVPPLQLSDSDAALELNMDMGLYPRAALELKELVGRALPLLQRAEETPPWRAGNPLRVLVTRDSPATRFALDRASEAKIRRIHPSWGAAFTVTIDDATGADFEAMHGSVFPHVAQMIVKLDIDDIRELGGIDFVDATTGNTVARWPANEDD